MLEIDATFAAKNQQSVDYVNTIAQPSFAIIAAGFSRACTVLIETSRLDEAERVLGGVRMADQDAAWEQFQAQLKLKREAAKSPEIEALEQKLTSDPDNLDLRQQLAIQYADSGLHREAMESLIAILQVDREHHDGGSRKALLDIIASLGKGDPAAVEYQRKLFGLLY